MEVWRTLLTGVNVVKEPHEESPVEESGLSLNGFKRAHVRQVLEACGGDVERAAHLLGVEPREVFRWLRDPHTET